ncbi:hypothetical protein D8Y24_12495 [Agrococcus lahaulensis]|nr:hypothetical protein D8Y24_12495 [Agrococcus lahaulensis]
MGMRASRGAPPDDASTSRLPAAIRPSPSASPSHSARSDRTTVAAFGHGPATSSVEDAWRRRAAMRAASVWVTRPGEAASTTGIASARLATTSSQARPGCGTSAMRSIGTPRSRAASTPRSGIPTIAPHAPAGIAAPRQARARLRDSMLCAAPGRSARTTSASPTAAGSTGAGSTCREPACCMPRSRSRSASTVAVRSSPVRRSSLVDAIPIPPFSNTRSNGSTGGGVSTIGPRGMIEPPRPLRGRPRRGGQMATDADARSVAPTADSAPRGPILCVTTNPAIDITYTIDELRPGVSHRVPTGLARAGGKGVNVARVLHQQHEDAMVIAPIGGPVQAIFVHDLDRSGIRHRLVEVDAPTRRTTAIVTPAGTTNLNEMGEAVDARGWEQLLDILREEAPGARAVASSGSLPPETPAHLCASIVEIAVAAGTPVIVDVGGEQLRHAVAAGATAVKPNRHELFDAMGGADPLDAARRLAALGTGTVFASLDVEGMLAVLPDGRAWHARIHQVLDGNPTGAGDAAVAALAQAIPEGATLEEQLARATAWSAAAVLAAQAGTIADPRELAAHIRITPIG